MNKLLTALFCLVFALVATTACAQNASSTDDLRGGIIYSKDGHALYFDLRDVKNGKETDLSANWKGVVIKPPFAASLNGEWIGWRQNYKFWVGQLPSGTPRAIRYANGNSNTGTTPEIRKLYGLPRTEHDFVWQNNEISTMSLSPDGTRFAFDGRCQMPSWLTNPNDGYRPYSSALTGAGYDNTFVGTFLLSTIYNQNNYDSAGCSIHEPYFGWGGTIFDETFYANKPGFMPVSAGFTADGRFAGMDSKLSKIVKKSVVGLAFSGLEDWQNGKKLVYFIYQMNGKYGPIEIRLINKPIFKTGEPGRTLDNQPTNWVRQEDDVVEAWEIPVSMPSCEGLAVRPDGSLAVWSNGNVYVVDGAQLVKGMKNAKTIGVTPAIDGHKGKKFLSYGDNVFRVQATTWATGVFGTCMHWVSNDAFLFADKSGELYLCRQGGNVEKLYKDVGGYFQYVAISPLETQVALGKKPYQTQDDLKVLAGLKTSAPKAKTVVVAERTARINTSEQESQLLEVSPERTFSIGGHTPFSWGVQEKQANLRFAISQRTTGSCQYVLLSLSNVKDLDEVTNPSQYFAGTKFNLEPDSYLNSKGKPTPCSSGLHLGWSLILRYDKLPDKYFGVQLVEVRDGTVVYKKRFWPGTPEPPRIALARDGD